MRRPQSITSAAPTSTFFGSHPRRAQVPPNGLESTIATCHPAERQRDATADAAAPVPISTRSKFFMMVFLYMKLSAALAVAHVESCPAPEARTTYARTRLPESTLVTAHPRYLPASSVLHPARST